MWYQAIHPSHLVPLPAFLRQTQHILLSEGGAELLGTWEAILGYIEAIIGSEEAILGDIEAIIGGEAAVLGGV